MERKLITASEARIIFGRQNRVKIADFNKLVLKAISEKKNAIFMPINTTPENFIARIKKAGYSADKVFGSYLISWKTKNQVYTTT